MKKIIKKTMYQLLICTIIFLLVIIITRKNTIFKSYIKENIYEKSMNFSYFNTIYNKYFKENIPLLSKFENTKTVFNETLSYSAIEKYEDGAKLNVDSNYLVPSLESGIVVFVGEKEKYGNIVIIQSKDKVDYWYGNMDNLNIKLYDYVEKGNLLGVADNYLYLLFQKNGEYLDYKIFLTL